MVATVLMSSFVPSASAATLEVTSGEGLRLTLGAHGGIQGLQIGDRPLSLVGSGGFSVRGVGGSPNLLPNAGFELDGDADGVPDGWHRTGTGATPRLVASQRHTGLRSVRIASPVRGTSQELRTDVPVAGDTVYSLSAWFRTTLLLPTVPPAATTGYFASAVVMVRQMSGAQELKRHYLHGYTDTSPWHVRSLGVRTLPATSSIAISVKIYDGEGTAWFDDLRLGRLLDPDARPLRGSVTASGPNELRQSASTSDGLELEATYTASADRITVDGSISSTTSADRPLELSFTLPFDATGWKWHEYARRSRLIAAGQTYAYETNWNVQSTSRYPWNTVSDDRSSLSIGVPLDVPRLERVRYGPAGLTMSMDLGLSPRATLLGPTATFRFVVFTSDPAWGFRQATEDYYGMFPSHFTRRIDPADEGGWGIRTSLGAWQGRMAEMGLRMDMVALGTDSGGGDTVSPTYLAADNAEGILTSAYNHHWGYKQWLAQPGIIPTYDEAVASLRDEAAGPTGSLPERRKAERAAAALKSTARDQNGRLVYEGYVGRMLQWFEDLDPLPSFTDWATVTRVYQVDIAIEQAELAGARLDAIHMDSTSGMRRWSAEDDHSRAHWAAALEPLTFSYDSGLVVKRVVFTDYRELRRTADYAHSLGMVVTANFNGSEARSAAWFGADVIDFFGVEQGLPNKAGPDDPYVTIDSMAMYKRSLAFQRPVSTLDGLVGNGELTPSQVESRLQLNLLYGIYPGIGGSSRFGRTIVDLHVRYAPLFSAVNTAGWQPVTRARHAGPGFRLERFGSLATGAQYLTVRNTSGTARDAEISFEILAPGATFDDLSARELITDATLTVATGPTAGEASILVPVPAFSTRLVMLSNDAGQ